jgi:hypothetical protein
MERVRDQNKNPEAGPHRQAERWEAEGHIIVRTGKLRVRLAPVG